MTVTRQTVPLTQAQRKVVAELLPKFAERLKLDEKNPRTISFTAKELETIRQIGESGYGDVRHARQ